MDYTKDKPLGYEKEFLNAENVVQSIPEADSDWRENINKLKENTND